MTQPFTIFPPQLPTDDEIKQNTLPSWEAVEPVLLSKLYPEILRLTIPTLCVAVPTTEIIDSWLPAFDGKKTDAVWERLLAAGRGALAAYPDGFFFKLDSRSPKDCGIVKFTAENLHELPGLFFSSERMLDDLCAQRFHRDTFVLCFRQWVDLADEQRVFVKDGRIQGVSRYDYIQPPAVDYTQDHIDQVLRDAGGYLAAISPYMAIKDYVFDFGYLPQGEPILIELNPYGRSDPCFFRAYNKIDGYAWKDL